MLRCVPGVVNRAGDTRPPSIWHHGPMATREELVDTIASFALFADLPDPRLEGIVHIFEEVMFAEGEKILRQGLTGSGFYVILDGEAAVVVDGTDRRGSAEASSSARSRSSSARPRSPTSSRSGR